MCLGAKEGRVKKLPKGINAGRGGGAPRCAGETWCVSTLMPGTQQTVNASSAYSFSRCWLSAYWIPGTALDTENIAVNKTNVAVLGELIF